MSLAIVFKGPEGIVLAADSRVTLHAQMQNPDGSRIMLPSTFDNATKLLEFKNHNYIAAVTHGLGAFGEREPRTPHSYLPEFEEKLTQEKKNKRMPVMEFAKVFSDFFMEQWNKLQIPEDYTGPQMVFHIGGFNEKDPYGMVAKFSIPNNPKPEEDNPGQFGLSWGGQMEFVNRIIKGFDPNLTYKIKEFLVLTEEKRNELEQFLNQQFPSKIPYPFLPLQDCVDLSMFLLRTTIDIQNWIVGVRGVGGEIDIAYITRTEGFRAVQQKTIKV